jgi:predicted nucleic acid-binding protein
MNYYFDTSVWIAQLDEKDFYHSSAQAWFEKIKKTEVLFLYLN